MLHGWGVGAAVFDPLREHCAAARDARALDLPGYGTSKTCEPYTLEALATRVSAVAPPRCNVVGWSLGAQVALAWAQANPEQVASLALIAVTPCFVQRDDWPCAMERGVFDGFRAGLEQDAAATLARFCALQAHGGDDAHSTSRRLRAALDACGAPDKDALEGGLRILLEGDLRPELPTIVQRALILHGACDDLVPAPAAAFLARTLPHARLEHIAGAAHAPFVSAPQRVGALLQEFLDER
jgi:pimeloyl-[acyl-carrier protein] methyl ester esterase